MREDTRMAGVQNTAEAPAFSALVGEGQSLSVKPKKGLALESKVDFEGAVPLEFVGPIA